MSRDHGQSVEPLRGSVCPGCGVQSYPSTRICHACLTEIPTTTDLAREGVVYSWTAASIGRGSVENPVVWAYVDLEGGARVFGEIVDTQGHPVDCEAAVELVEASEPPQFRLINCRPEA